MWSSVLWRPVRYVARWHTESQIAARRNALVAATALADRCREREDVKEFLARSQLDRQGDPISPKDNVPASL